jgi:NADPH:quinone reductase-like Zn-dependent oxidoreductase
MQDQAMISRHSWRCHAGSLNNLTIVTDEIHAEELPPNHILIQIKYIGLNFADVFAVLGLYSATPKGEFTPGLEFSGVVVESNDLTNKFKVGDQVMGTTRFGAYTTHLICKTDLIRHVPTQWSLEQASAFVCQSATAYYGLIELGGLKSKMTCLVHSGAGGVGLFCIDILLSHDCNVITTVSSQEKQDFLLERYPSLKAHNIIIRTTASAFTGQLKQSLQAIGDDGLDLVMDSLCGDWFFAGYNAIKRGGKVIVFGAASFTPHGNRPNYLSLAKKYLTRPTIDPMQMMTDNKGVLGFNLIWMMDMIDKLGPMLDDMLDNYIQKWQPPHVGKVFSFNEAVDALRYFQRGTSVGKIVLRVDDQVENVVAKPVQTQSSNFYKIAFVAGMTGIGTAILYKNWKK